MSGDDKYRIQLRGSPSLLVVHIISSVFSSILYVRSNVILETHKSVRFSCKVKVWAPCMLSFFGQFDLANSIS